MRRDRLGRPIGRNWWREWVVDLLRCETEAWLAAREAACSGWAAEEAEFEAASPRPALRPLLESLAGAARSS